MKDRNLAFEGFDPREFGYVLSNYCYPKGVHYFERGISFLDVKQHDLYRINFYISKDGNYIRIWNGLLEPFLAVQEDLDRLGIKMDAMLQYNTMLFNGRIKNNEDARVVLRCIEDYHLQTPSQLLVSDTNFECQLLTEELYKEVQSKRKIGHLK